MPRISVYEACTKTARKKTHAMALRDETLSEIPTCVHLFTRAFSHVYLFSHVLIADRSSEILVRAVIVGICDAIKTNSVRLLLILLLFPTDYCCTVTTHISSPCMKPRALHRLTIQHCSDGTNPLSGTPYYNCAVLWTATWTEQYVGSEPLGVDDVRCMFHDG